MTPRSRLAVVMTHPIQYYSPWFRFIAREAPEIDLVVIYATEPTPEQQGVGFGASFEWNVPLRDGYRNEVVRPARMKDRVSSDEFFGLDVADVARALEAVEPDAVLLNGWNSVTLVRAMRWCRRRRIPLLYRGDTHLGRSGATSRSFLWHYRTRWLLRRFSRYLSVGKAARDYLRSFGIPDRLVFDSPHAVDNQYFASQAAPYYDLEARERARREWGLSPEEYVVLFVGKLRPEKRPADAVLAMKRITGPATLLVVGSGILEAETRNLAREQGVSVKWLGFRNQSELGRVYAVSDCLVLPSQSETWGLVVNEAMATGLPCVVSDGVGCAPDLVVAGETGETYTVGDVDALARVLSRWRPDERRAGTARERCRVVSARYSFHAATEGLIRACRSVSGREETP